MSSLVILFVLAPLISGFMLLFFRLSSLKYQRVFSLLATALLFVFAIFILFANDTSFLVYYLGNWEAPFGIVLVYDKLSGIMLALTTFLALCALIHAISSDLDTKGPHFHTLIQMQLFGLNGAFLTGDLFNLFVFFEILLIASYGLILHGGGRSRTKAGLHYVIVNLVGSTLFLFAVATLYGVLGTLNIADLALRISELKPEDSAIVAASGILLLVVFGIKAAMFPLYLWLPGAYSYTSAPVGALFAIMTKVGIYSIIRVHGTLFGDIAGELEGVHHMWMLILGLLTIALGAFGVMSSGGLKRATSYLIVASVGTLLVGISINTLHSMLGSLYYLIHSTLLAAGMFLLSDLISRARGAHKEKIEPSSSFARLEVLGFFYFFGAIALAGMPPLSGFFGKLMILQSALDHSFTYIIFFGILASSFLVIVALARAGSYIFYNIDKSECVVGKRLKSQDFYGTILLFLASPLLVVFANSITGFLEIVATDMFNVSSYINAVLQIEVGFELYK